MTCSRRRYLTASAAAAAGAKGIFIEKPLCRTPAEADDMLAACQRANTKVAVAHRNRYHPVLSELRRLIDEGAIGRLLEIRGRGKEDHRGGAQDLWVLGSHLLNLFVYFGGRPRACTATLLQDDRPVTAADVRPGAEGVGPRSSGRDPRRPAAALQPRRCPAHDRDDHGRVRQPPCGSRPRGVAAARPRQSADGAVRPGFVSRGGDPGGSGPA